VGSVILAAGCGSSSSGGSASSGTDFARVSSAASGGGMAALVKAAQGDWYADYGGYVAIGYDPSKVKVGPTSFASLLSPAYKHQVAINNNPTEAAAAFDAVWAAALANGGSFGNIAPGVTFFKKLHAEGNFVPVAAGPTTVENGVPLLGHRAEPVAAGRGPADRAVDDGRPRHGGQGRLRRAAPGARGRADLPLAGAVHDGRERRDPAVARRGRLARGGPPHPPWRPAK
jgi:hypothetical protein